MNFNRARGATSWHAGSSDKAGRRILTSSRRMCVSMLDEGDVQLYLASFRPTGNSSAKDFEKALYLRLYQSALSRFPHNDAFVTGLLNSMRPTNMRTTAKNSLRPTISRLPSVRELFISHLAEKRELRNYLAKAKADTRSINFSGPTRRCTCRSLRMLLQAIVT